MQILENYQQIVESRKKLVKKKLSFLQNYYLCKLIRIFKLPIISFCALNKSWDYFRTFEFIESNLNINCKVLDVGCFQSEILPILKKAGYSNVYGIDQDSRIKGMPYQSEINYHIENFFNNSFADNFFDCLTCLSVIEHGFNETLFFSQFSRVLKKGGFLILSFDYWEKKINTDNIKMFNMDWNIFSKEEVLEILKNAEQKYKLKLVGNPKLDCSNKVINCANKDYTFAWLVFKKI
jgi:2-polyprenyl-3-methyl-5-hydroxy-6-metoxy-1,4-benzoquinol methylase